MHFCSWNLLEMESNLSQFWNVLESKKLTQDAISKLEEALLINPRKYDALWCWEMLKLLAHYALRTRMRQRFQKVLYCFQKAFNGAGGLKSPPGPWKLPVIGNLHQMVGRLPHHTLRDLAKKHGPIMYLKLGQLDAVIISSAKGAREVLKTHELTFAQRPKVWAAEVISFGQSSSIFAPYGDLWRSLRKICVFELLSATRVQSFRSVREEEVWNLIESIGSMSHEGLAINFRDRCCSFTSGVVSKAAFGKKCKDQKEFLSLLDEVNKLASGFDIPDLFPSLSFLGFITGLIPALKGEVSV